MHSFFINPFCLIGFFFLLVEKGSKYYLLRNIMLALFEIIDSDKVPYKSTTRPDSHAFSYISSGSHPLSHGNYSPQSNKSATDSSDSIDSQRSSNSNKDIFKRFASYTSMAPSSLGSNSNNVEICNEIVELICRCLQKCGEERGYMPLFKVIFTTLNEVSENRYTRLLDGRARDILLTGVITRMFMHVSKSVGLVVICDDVQCKSYSSLEHHCFNT